MLKQIHLLARGALALVVLLTSVHMAVARGAPMPAGTMVICAGQGVITVFVDDEGNPVGAPHICPDCALSLFSVPVAEGLGLRREEVWTRIAPVGYEVRSVECLRAMPRARGPPGLV